MSKSAIFFASFLLFSAFSNAQIQDIKDWQSRYDSPELYVESGNTISGLVVLTPFHTVGTIIYSPPR